ESGYRSMNDLSLMNVFLIDDIYGYYDALFFESMHSGEQIQEALDYIDAGVEYLLINPAEPTGWDEVVSEAYDAGVKVIFFDQIADVDPSYYLTYVHNDTYLSAQEAVSWLANEGLPEYNIIHLQGVPGSSAQIDRTAALDEMVAAHGNWNYVIQESGYCDYNTAKIIVRNVIDSGEDFNVIYAENDHMASGAEAALDEAGISHGLGGDVMIVSFDSTYYGLESVGNGYWNYDQQCNPDQASYIDAVIRDYENGIVPPSEIIVDDLGFDARTITSEDIDEYGI
ncbi:MAG: substrate-binding domain-containing protein, partial [Clostridiales bacterium]|nr:substrate-binding domain-containing protein [Clostridiales bacterium]